MVRGQHCYVSGNLILSPKILKADCSFHIRANVCDLSKTIVKRPLKILICSVVFRGSAKGLSQRAGVLMIKHVRSKDEQ